LLAIELHAPERVPQAELGLQPAVGLARDAAVTSAWALMARQSGKRGDTSILTIRSMKAAGSIGANQTAAPQIGVDDLADIARILAIARRAGDEIRQRDRQRLHIALRDVEMQHRPGRADAEPRAGGAGGTGHEDLAAAECRGRQDQIVFTHRRAVLNEHCNKINRETCRGDRR